MIDDNQERWIDDLSNRRLSRDLYSANRADPMVARRFADLRAEHAHMSAGLAWALANSGYGPQNPIAIEASRRAARAKAKRSPGFHSIGDVVKASSRVLFAGLSAPLEEVQGGLRALAGAAGEAAEAGQPLVGIPSRLGGTLRRSGSSAARIAIRDLIDGDRVDMGTGFFAGGTVEEERRRQSEVLKFAGAPISTGRLVAYAVSEPGTMPYNLVSGLADAAVAIGGDPANAGLGALSTARKARKGFTGAAEIAPTFQRALVNGHRKGVLADPVVDYLNSDRGQRLVEHIAGDASFDSIWRLFGKKAPVDTMLDLADETDPTAVRQILEAGLGKQVGMMTKPRMPDGRLAEVGDLPGFRKVRNARIWATMPTTPTLDLENADETVEQVDRWVRNMGITDPKAIASFTEGAARAIVQGDPTQRYDTFVRTFTDTLGQQMSKAGAREDVVRNFTTLWKNRTEEWRAFNLDDLANNASFSGVKLGANGLPTATPHMITEALTTNVPMPDPRAVRRAVSKWSPVLNNKAIELPTLAMEHLMNDLWRPLTLLRGAWIVRVVGEEQVRMAGTGLSSFVNHPLRALAIVAGDDGRLSKILRKARVTPSMGEDFLGDSFYDEARRAATADSTEWAKAQAKGSAGFRDSSRRAERMRGVMLDRWRKHTPDEITFPRMWANQMLMFRHDPLMRRVAAGALGPEEGQGLRPGVEGIKDWFFDGPGHTFRHALMNRSDEFRVALKDRSGADAWIDSLAERLDRTVRADPRLREAIATGALDGKAIRQGDNPAKWLVDHLDTLRSSAPTTVPAAVPGPDAVWVRNGPRDRLFDLYDEAIEALMAGSMSVSTNILSRSATFRQVYWQKGRDLIRYVKPDDQQRLLAAARDANLPKADIAALERMAARGSGDLTLEHADTVAKAEALTHTKDLLYDIAEKGQLADQLRLVFPFAEAWKEVLTRWAKIGWEEPRVLRRAQQGIVGARGNDGDASQGFFHTDPTTGEEVFSYPGTGLLTEKILGVRVPLSGTVEGLSMASQILPGFGPVVQIPAAKLIPNKPEWEWVREVVIPFGDPGEGGVVKGLSPAWLKRLQTAFSSPESDRQFSNTVGQVMRQLVASGDYSTNSVDDTQELIDAAILRARGLFLIRTFASFTAPSAPSPEFLAQDKDGTFHLTAKLADEYRRMSASDPEHALERFMDTYGEGAVLSVQGLSEGGVEPTSEARRLAFDLPDVRRDYPAVYGFFAPEGGDFDFDLYKAQLRSGERKPLSPLEMAERTNSRIASMVLRRAKERLGEKPSPEGLAWLSQVKDVLIEQYPGWSPEPKDLGRIPNLVRELERASDDDRINDTDAGQGLALYMAARNRAIASARDLGLVSSVPFAKAKAAEPIRDWLRSVGDAVAAEHPDFYRMWERILRKEMVDDVVEEAA